jgi:hypothetical protein
MSLSGLQNAAGCSKLRPSNVTSVTPARRGALAREAAEEKGAHDAEPFAGDLGRGARRGARDLDAERDLRSGTACNAQA